MLVKLTVRTDTREYEVVKVLDNIVCPGQEERAEEDIYTRLAKKLGWTEKVQQKIDNPLWYLSALGITKIEKL